MEVKRIINSCNDYMKGRVNIVVWVTNNCNQACKYCTVKSFINQNSKDRDIFDLETLDFIKDLNGEIPIELTLMGGEPTTILNYGEVHSILIDYLDKGLLKYVTLLTNGSFNIKHFNSLRYHDEFSFNISIHPDFMGFSRIKYIVENLKVTNKDFNILLKEYGDERDKQYLKYAEYLKQNNQHLFITPLYNTNYSDRFSQLIDYLIKTYGAEDNRPLKDYHAKLGNFNKCWTTFALMRNKLDPMCGRSLKLDKKVLLNYCKNGLLCTNKICTKCGGRECYVEVLK